ncbi:MAG: hypothetical protein BYD32DRAFT_435155 [Podila humilis]|nr:MAG: hypothetical protein BYD32DRAFT_435155 [Podila humilis]
MSPTFCLACVASLVFSGLLVRVDPVGALAGDLTQGIWSVEQRSITTRRTWKVIIITPQNQGHHHHIGSKKKTKDNLKAMNNGHHRHPHGHHHRPKHNRKKKNRKHKGKKHKHDHDHDDNKRRIGTLSAHRSHPGSCYPSSATFGILECKNRTISAVFCSDGKLQRPGAQLLEFAEMYAFSNSKHPKKKGHSNRISHLNIIRMKGP